MKRTFIITNPEGFNFMCAAENVADALNIAAYYYEHNLHKQSPPKDNQRL